MTTTAATFNGGVWARLRWVLWGGAAAVLSLPLLAMQFDAPGVHWTGSDFLVMGLMLALACAAFEVALRVARSNAYMVAAGLAVAAAFLMTWVNLAVGIIGNENDPVNLVFLAVVGVALTGVLFSKLKARGMARAMDFTALAQLAACTAALLLGGAKVFLFTTVFLAMWPASAHLFRRAERLTHAQD